MDSEVRPEVYSKLFLSAFTAAAFYWLINNTFDQDGHYLSFINISFLNASTVTNFPLTGWKWWS